MYYSSCTRRRRKSSSRRRSRTSSSRRSSFKSWFTILVIVFVNIQVESVVVVVGKVVVGVIS